MTHLEQTIRDAVEKGGFDGQNIQFNGGILYANKFASRGQRCIADIFLDPAFWQALGKARGWDKWEVNANVQWHRLIDHLSSGGTIEDFFTTLNKSK